MGKTADDFFNEGEEPSVQAEKASNPPPEKPGGSFLDNDMRDFIRMQSIPREEVEPPPVEMVGDAIGEIANDDTELIEDDGLNDEERAMAEQLEGVSDGHQLTAKFILKQMDKFFGFGFSIMSGMEPERYRRYKEGQKLDEDEVLLLAALIKKYQVTMSLEVMFITAIFFGYAPMGQKAWKDAKAMKAKKEKEYRQQLREEAEYFKRNPQVVQ